MADAKIPEGNSSVPNGRFSIPDESAAPKAEPTPKYRQTLPNYADDPLLVASALSWVKNNKQYCEGQERRKRNIEIRKQADSMWRIDKTRSELKTDEAENIEDTRANYPSTIYNETIKVIAAGEKSVILGNEEELPMQYEPLPDAEGYLEDEGLRISEQQNAVLAWAFERDKMRDKIGSILTFLAKYGNQVIEMDWDYRVDERYINVPIFEDGENGEREVVGRKFEKRKVVIANNPRLNKHDMVDCLFDANIDDVQMQNFFDIRKDMQLGSLWQLQASGKLINTGKIKSDSFNGRIDDDKENEKQSREDHRGGIGTVDNQTNLVEVHRTRIRLPIDPETGIWDEAKYLPTWFETWWAGRIEGTPVCLMISPNPHHNKKIPIEIVHSEDDDNGAFHLGNPELLKSGYSMLTTIINQYFDNVTERNQLPSVIERGAIGVRNNTVRAGGNLFILKDPGAKDPTPLNVTDTTQQTFTAIDKTEELVRRSGGVNKALLGEGLGARASASEAINTLQQALKPALEDAKRKANQILPFTAEWVMEMTRQFSNPKQQISIKGPSGEVIRVFPGRLYGEQVTRVVAIKKLQDNILRVQQEEQMMTQFIPAFKDYMSAEGITDLGNQIAKNRQFSKTDSWWKIEDDYDASIRARHESMNIIVDGIKDFPQPEENHKTHLKEHESVEQKYMFSVPPDKQNKEGLVLHKQHIAIHKKFIEDQKAQIGQAQAPAGEPVVDEGAPRTSGELAGDTISGAAPNIGAAPSAAGAAL